MRAVLDPNVIISGVLSAEGAPARILHAWRQGRVEVIVSPQLLEELRRALAYPKLRRRVTEVDAARLMSWVSQAGVAADDPGSHPTLRSADPGDDYLIALAAAQRAVLVTGDQHLLDLRGKMPIYAARAFLEMMEGEGG